MKTELKEVRKEFGKHGKLICPECRKLVAYSIFEKRARYAINDEEIEYNGFYGLCDECKSEIYVPGLEDNNMEILEAKYRTMVTNKRNEADNILLSDKSADAKVYKVFQLYKDDLKRNYPQLYYALLEWKDSHLKELLKETTVSADQYFKGD